MLASITDTHIRMQASLYPWMQACKDEHVLTRMRIYESIYRYTDEALSTRGYMIAFICTHASTYVHLSIGIHVCSHL